MSNEVSRTRAQYLNGLAVGVVGSGISAVFADAPLWVLLPTAAISLTLHWAAVQTSRNGMR